MDMLLVNLIAALQAFLLHALIDLHLVWITRRSDVHSNRAARQRVVNTVNQIAEMRIDLHLSDRALQNTFKYRAQVGEALRGKLSWIFGRSHRNPPCHVIFRHRWRFEGSTERKSPIASGLSRHRPPNLRSSVCAARRRYHPTPLV